MKDEELKRANEIRQELEQLEDFWNECEEMAPPWKYVVSAKIKRWCLIYGTHKKEILVPKSVERELMSCLRAVADKRIRELRDEFSSI